MKRFVLSLAMAVLALTAGQALAQEAGDSCPASGTCPATGACPAQSATVSTQDGVPQQTEASDTVCPITEGMKLLPAIHYFVGDQECCCSNSAKSLAKSKELPVTFKVGENTFETEEAAFMGLIEATEQFVTTFATPQTCEESGKTMIAGESCDCPVKASEKAEMVKAAMEKVAFTFKVGEETCSCPVSAKEMAEKAGQPVVFVLDNEEISCEHMARLKLAQARYRAALTALHSAGGESGINEPAQQTLTSEIK